MPVDASTIRPNPSPDEAAAIVAAIEALWPRAHATADPAPAHPASSWRFSGRWWSLPVPVRRDRPWH